ncbi:CoA-transferase family III domain-containing protein [Pilobolus umbonatus]|nr:CoA-transferase family III domain-containing protein [Pilobolus umbonatus]
MSALSKLVVLEMAGLAPVPYAGMILADFGAKVIRVDKTVGFNVDVLVRNKRSIAMDLKNPLSIQTILKLAETSDVIIDPFRPGVMEKLGLGPDAMMKVNPRLIYARISGFGQSGPASQAAGHDINYLAISGALGLIGPHGSPPVPPANMLADFAGGGLMCVMGILMALFERSISNKGQVIDANLVTGTSYLATFPYLMQKNGLIWEGERGTNGLDGGAPFYQVYQTKDNRYMAVGCIEPQFYNCFIDKMGLKDEELPDQSDKESWPSMKSRFSELFATKTQGEWTEIFDGSDACVTPVLSFQEPIPDSSVPDKKNYWPRQAPPPQPSPILSRTPANEVFDGGEVFLTQGMHTVDVLREFNISEEEIKTLLKSRAIVDAGTRPRL